MYLVILFILLGLGLGLLVKGQGRKHLVATLSGLFVLIMTAGVYASLDFWGEMLWFNELGYSNRFWVVVMMQLVYALIGGMFGALVVYLLTFAIPRVRKIARFWPEITGTLIGGSIGFQSWKTIMMFFHGVDSGMVDPILDKDAGFYLFSLPFYELVHHSLFLFSGIALVAVGLGLFLQMNADQIEPVQPENEKQLAPLRFPIAALLMIFAYGQWLNRQQLMTSTLGVVAGPGWTDVHVRMPAYTLVGWLCFFSALILLVSPLRRRLATKAEQRLGSARAGALTPFILPPAIVGVVSIFLLAVAPLLAQWLLVEPNEITRERDYIEHNIKFTRHGFGMDEIEEREFAADSALTRSTIEQNQDLMSEVRLWDWRALADVYEQFQEIRLYYSFPDVDIDRYRIGDDYRQVMVSPREMDLSSLPSGSSTFVNKRFKYTHGYGVTMSTVRDFTPEGLPNLLIKDIPPKATHPSLEVERPQIYYGTLTDTPVVANTKEKEFDYPSGETNVYNRYQGEGGVELSNLWRKFVFGWKFDGTRFLLSGYPTDESRVLFRREVVDRAREIAPFLQYESDPYIVLDGGQLYWIIDAYTVSGRFPYSEPFLNYRGAVFRGANYIRNSVKVVVDAYHGDVSFYIFEEDDPIIRVWNDIFPNLFKSQNEMPEGLQQHVRYPAAYLLIQALVYSKYHMADPAVFYNQEDLWVRATEKYDQNVQPVEPYYVMWKLPGTPDPQFSIILPFTPKNKQVLIGWMAGLCDGENYGRLLTYKFPKEKRVLGPQQVETKIDQDRHLSGQLTLWDQRGSKVIRGNVLAIPIEDTLLYVEPIYLQAETAAYPELRLVAVMHNDNLSYAESFEEAIDGLFAEGTPSGKATLNETADGSPRGELIKQASTAFDDYLRLQGDKRFQEAADELETLRRTLEQLGRENSAGENQ